MKVGMYNIDYTRLLELGFDKNTKVVADYGRLIVIDIRGCRMALEKTTFKALGIRYGYGDVH